MCKGVPRLTPSSIETLIKESMNEQGKDNNEDVARLLCLYAFVTIFFTTSGTNLSWSYVKYVEDLDAMRTSNWPGAIKNYLKASIQKSHNNPENVTGCVIALLVSIQLKLLTISSYEYE